MHINKKELKKAKKELLGGLLLSASAWDDTGIKVPMIEGRYYRSGARGFKFHANEKSVNKYKKNLSGINLPALESPERLGVSEVGSLIRSNLIAFNRYSQYKKLSVWQKIIYTLLLKRLQQGAFDDSLGRCKEIHTFILKKKRKVLDSMKNKC